MSKNLILSAIMMAFVFASCESNTTKNSETATESTVEKTVTTDTTKKVEEQLFACSMHPEVIGKKDEKCSKCGMDLTEPVKK